MKEYKDVESVAQTLEQDAAFHALGQAGEAWSKSAEFVASAKQLEAFSHTQEAKAIETSGKALESELKAAVAPIRNGVRVANAKLPAL